MLKETTEHVTANAILRDEGAHLWRVGACSRWKTTDSGRLGAEEFQWDARISGGLKIITKLSQGNLQGVSMAIFKGSGNGGIWTCFIDGLHAWMSLVPYRRK